MKELQAIVRAILAPDAREWVLATLLTVEGSSYRRPGARLLLSDGGDRIGSISGGCLEDDLIARARRVGGTGRAEAVVYDTTSENDLVWGVGLGCHGVVRILIEKLPRRPAWAEALARNFAARRPTPLAVVHQSADPAVLGTRLAPTPESGPAMADAEVYFETVAPPTALFIFGAGDDAQPLVRFARELGWHVTVADPRPAYASPDRFPDADNFIVAPADALVAHAAPGPDALAVVMTHHYVHDVPLLRDLLPRPLAYLGLLGPKKRAEKILADLATGAAGATPALAPHSKPTGETPVPRGMGVPPMSEECGVRVGLTPARQTPLHAPVGLDLGADSPEQVALAMVAEMQSVLTHRDARPLRERTRPIHE